MSNNAFDHPLRVIGSSACFQALNEAVGMVSGAHFCPEVLPKKFICGLDEPLFVQKKFILGVHEPIVASIDATGFPCNATFLKILFKFHHRTLLPTAARVSPFPVHIKVWVFVKCCHKKVSYPSQHSAFTTSHAFKNFLALGSVVVDLGPFAKLGTRKAKPDLLGTPLTTLFLQTHPRLRLVYVIALGKVDSSTWNSMFIGSCCKPAVL